MAIKCPKCGHARGPGEKAPAWQCPGCGAAYTKVMAEAAALPDTTPPKPLSPPPPPARHPDQIVFPGEMAVRVVDIKMPFWSMVTFMVKWAIASIPAFIILAFIGTFLIAFFGGMFHSTRG